MFDLQSLIKYLLEGFAVAIATYLIPRRRVTLTEISLIALTAAAVFAVLDQFAPLVSIGARHGAGFGIGLQQIGWGGPSFEGFNDPTRQTTEYDGYNDYGHGEGFQNTTTNNNNTDANGSIDNSMYRTNTNNTTDYMTTSTTNDDVVDSQGVCNQSIDGQTCTYSDGVGNDKKGYFLCRKDGNNCTAVRACQKIGGANEGDLQCQLDPQVEQNQSQFSDLTGRSCQLQDINGRQQCRLTQKEDYVNSDEIVGFEGFSKVF